MDLLDSGDWDTADIASMTGLSQRTIQRRVARARDTRAAEADPQPVVGGEDVEWLELVEERPRDAVRGYYDLATDQTSHDGTTEFVLIGTGRGGAPRRNRIGTGRIVRIESSNGAHEPAKYRPPGDGLKGGVG